MRILTALIHDAQTLLGLVNIINSLPSFMSEARGYFMKIDDLKAAMAALRTEQAAAFDRVAVDVAELKRLVASGQATDADFDALILTATDMATAARGVDPDPAFPAAPTDPVPLR
jgi:hypothetical protein